MIQFFKFTLKFPGTRPFLSQILLSTSAVQKKFPQFQIKFLIFWGILCNQKSVLRYLLKSTLDNVYLISTNFGMIKEIIKYDIFRSFVWDGFRGNKCKNSNAKSIVCLIIIDKEFSVQIGHKNETLV